MNKNLELMKITMVGTGYVGLVSGTCFSETGIHVTCVDIDKQKIDALNAGKVPIYEPGLDDLIKKNTERDRLKFTTKIEDTIPHSEVAFIAVGTPPDEDGSADLQYVLAVAKDIGKYMQDYIVVVVKSTVPIGTSKKVKAAIKEELKKRNVNIPFDVASNPEFLKEGDAINDFMNPDRIVVGVSSKKAQTTMERLYHQFVLNNHPILFMDIPSAEMTKYAANAMLATRISFMNDLSNLCEKVGADINSIRIGIGSDPRIGNKFLYAGTGYGGSCFPKDVKALIKTSIKNNHELKILKAVEEVNERQKSILVKKLISFMGSEEAIKGLKIALWGLSFKPNTDDMREAPALTIIEELTRLGATITAYDPIAMNEAKRILGNKISYATNEMEAVKDADVLFIVTEWLDFRSPDFDELGNTMNQRIILDGRNIYDKNTIKEHNFTYLSIGQAPIYSLEPSTLKK